MYDEFSQMYHLGKGECEIDNSITVSYDRSREHLEEAAASTHGAWKISFDKEYPSPSERRMLMTVLETIEEVMEDV